MQTPLVAAPATRPESDFWPADPLHKAPVVLLARHLEALPDAAPNGDVVWLNNHPVRLVDAAGLIVMVDPKNPILADTRVSFTLDDGTGFFECVHWRHDDDPPELWRQALAIYRLGRYVHALGRLRRFRGKRQITVQSSWADDDPQAECLRWVRAGQLWNECYRRPFRIPHHCLEWKQQQQQQRQQQQQHDGGDARSRDGGGAAASPIGDGGEPSGRVLQQHILQVLRRRRDERIAAPGMDAAEIARELPPPRATLRLVKAALCVLEEEGGCIYAAGQAGRDNQQYVAV